MISYKQIRQHKHFGAAVGVLAVLGIAAAAYFIFFNKTKSFYANGIIDMGGSSSYAGLLSFDEAYLQAWYKGLKAGSPTFAYAGKNYNTQGGTAYQAAALAPPKATTQGSSDNGDGSAIIASPSTPTGDVMNMFGNWG